MTTQLRLLGPVELRVADTLVDIGHLRQRAVLAILAVEAGRAVSIDQLEDRLWGDAAPQRARKTLHSYLTRLRRALSEVPQIGITRQANGYVLDLGEAHLDLHSFRRHLDRARRGGENAMREWELALRLWRDDPFTGIDLPWLNSLRHSLSTEHYAAELEYAELRLAAGRHADLLAELDNRATDNPLDQRAAGQVMIALHRSGRSADALEHYRRLRQRLVEQLGQEPNGQLRELHRRILADEPDGSAPPRPPEREPVPAATPVPRQLPAAPRRFTGRQSELDRLGHGDGVADTAPIWLITGPGGMGKSWLALHWAHRRSDRFPDGQLYVDLQGFHPMSPPVAPEDALADLLEGLGVRPSAVPRSLTARSALFRSLVAQRRLLLLLDNAANSEQVAPLLPGGTHCTTIVTSRHGLTALSSGFGASALPLGVLTEEDARSSLAGHIGMSRLIAEPEAVTELLAHCAGLSLAVGIIGSRAAARPDLSLSSLVIELRDDTARLDLFDTGELATGIRAVLDGSIRGLSEPAMRLFRLWGLIPGTNLDRHALASLTGSSPTEIRRSITELERSHLIEQHRPGRFQMHDLTRLYAAELVTDRAPGGDELLRAKARWVDHYLHTANAHCTVLSPKRLVMLSADAEPGTVLPATRDVATARQWLTSETANVLAAQQLAAKHGWDAAGRFGAAIGSFWLMRGHYDLATTIINRALDSGISGIDERGFLYAMLSFAHQHRGRIDEASDAADRALELLRDTADLRLSSYVHHALGSLNNRRGDHRSAIRYNLKTVEYDVLRKGQTSATILNNLGWNHAQLGEYAAAERYCNQALESSRQNRQPLASAAALDSLAFIAQADDRPQEAIELYRRALDQFAEIRRHDPTAPLPQENLVLEHLGDTYTALGKSGEAAAAWQRAARGFHAQHQFDASTRVKAKLEGSAALDVHTGDLAGTGVIDGLHTHTVK